MNISIPTSLGELIDRITILEIKKSLLKDKTKLDCVCVEFNLLSDILKKTEIEVPELLYQKLYSVNLSLWNIENELRQKEKQSDFGKEFVELARSVYQTNDFRFLVKQQITELDENVTIQEQKSYA